MILFRGKRIDNGEWVEGDLIQGENSYIITDKEMHHAVVSNGHISCCLDRVDPKTVSQATGLKDKNGKIIFEGDMALFTNKNLSDIYEKKTVKIEYSKCSFWCAFESSKTALSLFVEDDKYEFEVIGNIYDKGQL